MLPMHYGEAGDVLDEQYVCYFYTNQGYETG